MTETSLPIEQIRARVEAALRREHDRHAAQPEPAKGSRGRALRLETRRKIAARRFEQTRRLVLASGHASKLTRRRLEAGLSQADLGRRAGTSIRSLQRSERDVSSVSPKTLAKIAQALGVPPAEII